MDDQTTGSRLVDDYIAGFPPDVQARLQAVRTAIRAAAPDAREKIAYQMPKPAAQSAD